MRRPEGAKEGRRGRGKQVPGAGGWAPGASVGARVGLFLLLALALVSPVGAQETVTAYGSRDTLRLKVSNSYGLEARLEVRLQGGRGPVWAPVAGRSTGPGGWKPFAVPQGYAPTGGTLQYLCDLPLGEARKMLPESRSARWVRVTVRRSGAGAWFAGSWQGEFVPPAFGVKAWTFWLPSVPPPIQSTEGLIGVLALLLWIGCIAAVRAEAGRMGLEGPAALWRHAGWLHLPGALLFFATHPPPPTAGIGRELSPPRRVRRTAEVPNV
jgi:hypothetical protein